MSMPSFEETNNPGYDEVFDKPHLSSNSATNNSERKKKINELLDCKLLVTVFYLMENGLELNSKQEKLLKEKYLKSGDFNIIEDLFSQNIKFDEKYIGLAMIHKIKAFQERFNVLNSPTYEETAKYNGRCTPLLNEYLQNSFRNGTLSPILFKAWKSVIEDMVNGDVEYVGKDKSHSDGYLRPSEFYDEKIVKPVTELKHFLFESVDKDEYNECINLIKKIPSKAKAYGFDENCEWLVGQLKRGEFYIQTIQSPEKEKENLATIMTNKQDSDFPEEVKGLISQIIRIYGEISQNKDILDTETKFNINNLYHDKLPDIVNNYLSINSSHKKDLIGNQKKNADDVFSEMISDINDIFEHTLMNINKNKIRDLSVSKEYFNQIKKGM